jgi:hypothetical protein
MRDKCGSKRRGRAPDWRFDLAIVLVLLVAGLVALSLRYNYQPCGDPLYDDFARLFLKKFNAAYPPDYWLWVEQHCLKRSSNRDVDLRSVASWEDKYASDPRYWQLRRDCGADGRQTNIVFENSIRRGVYNEASFYYSAWDVDRSSTTLSEKECYDLAIAQNPNNAFYYYMKAYYYLYNNEYDEAWEALLQGNAAPECHAPRQFPNGYILKNYDKSLADANKLIVARTHRYTALPDTRPIKASIKRAYLQPTTTASNEFLDDLGWAELQMIRAEKYEMIMQVIYTSLYLETICQAADQRMKLNQAQAREYAFIKQQRLQFRQLGKMIPEVDYNNESRAAYIEYYNALEQEYKNCGVFAALTNSWPSHPLSSWARGELAGYPVPDDFVPLAKHLPPSN